MRKVTQATVAAFMNKECKAMGNTTVNVTPQAVYLILHGNTIAFSKDENIFISSAGWQTATTKERLNGLLEYLYKPKIYQKEGIWYRDMQDGREEFPVHEYVAV